MSPITAKTLGFTININVPSSVEEFDQLAKKVGACLNEAVKNVIYRGVLNTFRAKFVEAVEAETSIARKTKPTGKFEKDDAGKDTEVPILVYAETEGDYFDRVLANPDAPRTLESFTDLANRIAADLVFDPSESEKKPAGPKKLSKAVLDAAKTIIDAGKADAVAAMLATKLGITVDSTQESLARAIAEDQRRKNAEKNLSAEYVA